MADLEKSGAAPPTRESNETPPKEWSMELRLLLAFILMGVVMLVTPYFLKVFAPPPARPAASAPASPPAATTPAPAAPAQPVAPAVEKPAAAAHRTASVPAPGATPQQAAPPFVVDTNLFHVVFSNQGATVRNWVLKKYKGNDDKPLDLVNTAAGLEYPFSLYFMSQQPSAKVNWAYYTQTPDAGGLGVSYAFSDGHTSVRKVFHFQKNSYLLDVTTEVSVDGQPLPHLIDWRGGFGDLTLGAPAATESTAYYDLTQQKLVTPGNAKNGPIVAHGDFSFFSLSDKYFAAVFLPEQDTGVETVTLSDIVATPFEGKKVPFFGAAVGDAATNRFRVFVGPKDYDLLKSIDPKLEQVVDFGWLGVVAKPLFLLVDWANRGFIHNFGWSIVVVTIVLNSILFPLRLSNMKSMRKMQALKPQIDAINAKYKNVGMRDPKKADQNQEVMGLYKKYGVNPMGGCFPMLIQIPFFIAFYKVFSVSVEMRGATWLWVTDLSQPEHLAIKVLPIVMIASQFLMQKMTPQANVDPNQKNMMMMMPLIFGAMFYNLPSGLVLYYLTSNLVSMGQQWFFNHTAIADEAARSVEPPKKKIGRK
ncbi:MAG: membrane protein insertase YidC [Bryobacteraceae bacterium]